MSKIANRTMMTVVSVFICLAFNLAYGDYICGDANSDETVNISDAVHIINYVFIGGDPPDPLDAGDCNCDEACNVSDAVWIINYVFIGGNDPCDTNGDGVLDCSICPLTVTDIDGNIYQVIQIGDQCWMAENLEVTHYKNGDPIPNVTDGEIWDELSTGAYCNYNNSPSHVGVYGRLYNWYAIEDSRNIAPEGWHVPSDAEWKQMEMHLGMSQAAADGINWRGTDEGGKMKEAGTLHWTSPNTGATNESGLTALPGGWRDNGGYYHDMYEYSWFWTSEEYGGVYAYSRTLHYTLSKSGRGYNNKQFGYSVRCVMDQ